jgi:hypothetical protein
LNRFKNTIFELYFITFNYKQRPEECGMS